MKNIRSASRIMLLILALTWSGRAMAYMDEAMQWFTYAQTKSGNWHLAATTGVGWDRGRHPSITAIECRAESDDMDVLVKEPGTIERIDLHFASEPDAEGSRYQMTLLGDHLWLFIDEDRWELAHVASRQGLDFDNVQGPVFQAGPDDIEVGDWVGYVALRRNAQDQWIPLSRFHERIIAARKLQWSFKSRNWRDVDHSVPGNRLPEGWQSRRYTIHKEGLAKAIDWCAEQVMAKEARTLPPEGVAFSRRSPAGR